MVRKALYDLSYGVFLLSAKAGDRVNGCITNTCIQVASSPVRVAFSVLNGNLTCEVLKEGAPRRIRSRWRTPPRPDGSPYRSSAAAYWGAPA